MKGGDAPQPHLNYSLQCSSCPIRSHFAWVGGWGKACVAGWGPGGSGPSQNVIGPILESYLPPPV